MSGAERHVAARVLDALLREDYGGLAARMTHDKDGVRLVLPTGRVVRLVPGSLFQDFVCAPEESPALAEVLDSLAALAGYRDGEGVAAFAEECRAAVRGRRWFESRRDEVAARIAAAHGTRDGRGVPGVVYESLAAFAEHPVHPTSRARPGLAEADTVAYAPEFAPEFRLRWARVPVAGTTRAGDPPGWWPRDPGPGHTLFPVHPLTVPLVRDIPGVRVLDEPYRGVQPTLSMRTVAAGPRTHLKLPLPVSTLGARNRRSIKPATLGDGARAELLLREIVDREPGLDVLLADEQTYAHAGHEYLGWMARRLPEGEIVPVAALLSPFPGRAPRVLDDLAARYAGGDAPGVLADYLRVLFTWNVRLFVTYGVALEAHQQNLALVFRPDGPARLLVKDNDGMLASPARLRAAGLAVPDFTDPRMLTDDPHALADVFVTITLHLAAAAVAFGAGHGGLVAEALDKALAEYGGHPMARLLRARTLDAARLVGKSMVTAGTLADRGRVAADVNKHYGTSGPNYLRHHRGKATS
ncbi:hypothetical protein Ssi03_73550 [Sphaerisporangium siamense]|uniref:Siderophore synthetase component n=1 Tax=Sphaerisporangium siamense TaxID=795645 RepID=A0A7W7G9X5_9ACTN|nr:IucA/IucC family protein [Sphaerisporangium siamense]MBB4701095.1 siderophore synthetase component [Sphaerisporangium siamense]GII89365.1 hypothetical protein Ssi03_73550 [Sphaerisporangium siamense]